MRDTFRISISHTFLCKFAIIRLVSHAFITYLSYFPLEILVKLGRGDWERRKSGQEWARGRIGKGRELP